MQLLNDIVVKCILTWDIFITKCEENGTGYIFSKILKLYPNVYNLSFFLFVYFVWP